MSLTLTLVTPLAAGTAAAASAAAPVLGASRFRTVVLPRSAAVGDVCDARQSGGKLVGKCLVPLQPLLSTCELTVSTPILTEGRREAGGSVEMSLRLRKPISSDEVVVTEVQYA